MALPPGRNKVLGWTKQGGGLDSAHGPWVCHLCFREFLGHGLQFLLEPSGCVTHMGGLTCLEIELAIVLGHGPICLVEFGKLLKAGQQIGKRDTG